MGITLAKAAEVGDLLGVAPLVDHPDEQEEGAGGEPWFTFWITAPCRPGR
jgi:hypothetical protein